jgi:hypothetical protein
MSAPLKNEIDDTDSGFRAELTGVALADLVQLECAARSNRTFRVRSGNSVGYLYFAEGQIIHAATENAIGEAAAVELLSWSDGAFEASTLPSPQSPTIRRSWQHLLLMAAQAHDEVRRKKLVSFPKSPRAAMLEAPRPEARGATTSQIVQTNRSDARVASPSRPDADAAASVAAYAVRLADLIGDDLGMGAVVALELEVGSMRVFVHREPSGKVVGASTVTDADAALYRERWGL